MGDTLSPMLADGALARPRADFHARLKAMQQSITAVADCRTPTIASVHGWCIGGGVDLIRAVDIRYASADAKFSVREVKLAIVADVGSLARLPLILSDGPPSRAGADGQGHRRRARREDRSRQRRLRRRRGVAGRGARHRRRDRRQPAAGGAGHQGRARRAAHRPGVGQPALRRGVELGVPAVEGPHRGHHRDVRQTPAGVHGRIATFRRALPQVITSDLSCVLQNWMQFCDFSAAINLFLTLS